MMYFMDGKKGSKLWELPTAQKMIVHSHRRHGFNLSSFRIFTVYCNENKKLHLSFLQKIMLFTFASDSSNLRGRFGRFSAVELTENATNKTFF